MKCAARRNKLLFLRKLALTSLRELSARTVLRNGNLFRLAAQLRY